MGARWMRNLGIALILAAILNFVLFGVVSMILGGDAVKGKVENGEFFLADRKKRTKVSAAVWHYSRVHARSLFVTHPLGIAGFGLLAVALPRRRRGVEATP